MLAWCQKPPFHYLPHFCPQWQTQNLPIFDPMPDKPSLNCEWRPQHHLSLPPNIQHRPSRPGVQKSRDHYGQGRHQIRWEMSGAWGQLWQRYWQRVGSIFKKLSGLMVQQSSADSSPNPIFIYIKSNSQLLQFGGNFLHHSIVIWCIIKRDHPDLHAQIC